MTFYALYIIISSLVILLVSSDNIEIRTYNWYLIFLISFLFSGLRYQIGTDYLNYYYVFDDLRTDDIALLEYGNYLLMYLVQLIDGPFQLYILVTSFIICYSFFKFIKLFSKDKSISLFIFLFFGLFFLSSLNFIRQFLAISFFILALCSISENKKIKTIFFIVFSILFHTSALVTLPIFLFYKLKINYKHVIVTICASIFILSVSYTLLLNSSYGIYIERAALINEDTPPLILVVGLIMSSSFFIIYIFRSKKKNSFDNVILTLLTLSICSLIPIILFKDLPYNVFLRINNFFMISYILIIPSWIMSFKSLYSRILIKFFVFIILVLYFIRTAIILGPEYNLFPYKSIFHV